MTPAGQKLLEYPKLKGINDGLLNHGIFYRLKKGEEFEWKFDLRKCFKVSGGDFDISVKPRMRWNTGWRDSPGGGAVPIAFEYTPNVRIAGKRITIPNQKTD